MPELKIEKVPTTEDRSLPIFAEFDRLADRMATPGEIIIKANHERTRKSDEKAGAARWSEFRSDEVFRRVDLPSPVDVGQVTASLKNGLLVVIAPLEPAAKSTPKNISIAQGS